MPVGKIRYRRADGKHGLEEYLQTQVVYLETDI